MSGIPNFTTAPIDAKTGRWNREWYLWLQGLWERSGGLSDMTESDANSLTRNRRGAADARHEPDVRRQRIARKADEVAPGRHASPRLVVTKETYKPFTLIKLYTGLTSDIPAGWQLADGSGGSPNLSDRFVVGSGNLYGLGTTGGSTTITANNLPTHTHDYFDLNTTYTAATTAVQSGSGTTVVTGITGTSTDTLRPSNSNTTTTQPYLPPYYALAFIINNKTVTVVTDAKLR